MNMIECKSFDLSDWPKGQISRGWVHIVNDGIGRPIKLPILVARGVQDGPTLGLSAAVHGNELNGIPVIQKLFNKLDPSELCGNIVGILVMNVPGVLQGTRAFNDKVDLNRIAPGNPKGNMSEVYIYRLLERIIYHFDYLIDLHTASTGRRNSYYIRADMSDEVTSRMAKLQGPELILNNPPQGASVRGCAAEKGIKSITIELRDPNLFQYSVIDDAVAGIQNVCYDLGLMPGDPICTVEHVTLCDNSSWCYTNEGGILEVQPHILDEVKEGERIATVRSIFGHITKEFYAPSDGIVIGKSVSPINQTGSRILHLGLNPRLISCTI